MDLSWRYGFINITFMNKTFLFFKIESWNFQHLFDLIEFCETSQNVNSFSLFSQLLFSFFSIGCLIEFKFREVSWNSFSLLKVSTFSILKNKKVLFLKKRIFKLLWKPTQFYGKVLVYLRTKTWWECLNLSSFVIITAP